MAKYYIKRETGKLSKAYVTIYGPLESDDASEGQNPQAIKFKRGDGASIGFCELKPGSSYKASMLIFGERKQSLKLSIQPVDRTKDFQNIASLDIPASGPVTNTIVGIQVEGEKVFKVEA